MSGGLLAKKAVPVPNFPRGHFLIKRQQFPGREQRWITKALPQASTSFLLPLYASAVLENPLLYANCRGCNICTVHFVLVCLFPLKPGFWTVTRPATKDKAAQEHNFTEILAEGEFSPARVLTAWMPAADAGGAWKAS